MLSLFFGIYFLRLIFGLFIFFTICKIIKKYLNIDIMSIFKDGINNIYKFIIEIKDDINGYY